MCPSVHIYRKGHLDTVKVLITNRHCDVNVSNNYGCTPLHVACWWAAIVVLCVLHWYHWGKECTDKTIMGHHCQTFVFLNFRFLLPFLQKWQNVCSFDFRSFYFCASVIFEHTPLDRQVTSCRLLFLHTHPSILYCDLPLFNPQLLWTAALLLCRESQWDIHIDHCLLYQVRCILALLTSKLASEHSSLIIGIVYSRGNKRRIQRFSGS